jgi:hypothetical protein
MTTDAQQKLETAIQELIAEGDPGVYMTGYALVATGVLPNKPGFTAYRYVIPIDQPIHVTRGLVDMLEEAACDYDAFTVDMAGDDEDQQQ